MKQSFLLSLGLFFSVAVLAQTPNFTAVLSNDTTNLEAIFEITFKVEGAKSESFVKPAFSDFDVIYQNQSTQMNIINGEITQSISYVFGLKAREEGSFAIDKASVEIEGTRYYTDYVKVVVDKNYTPVSLDKRRNDFWDSFEGFPNPPMPKPAEPVKKPKTKRKVYKI